MDIFAHPRSTTPPISAVGTTYQDVLEAFAARWQAGKVRDLARGLREVDRRINAMILRATGADFDAVAARSASPPLHAAGASWRPPSRGRGWWRLCLAVWSNGAGLSAN